MHFCPMVFSFMLNKYKYIEKLVIIALQPFYGFAVQNLNVHISIFCHNTGHDYDFLVIQ